MAFTSEPAAEPLVYPVFMQDTTKPNHVIVSASLRFDDVLDGEKLRSSLSQLLQVGHWRKLAGRLKKNGDGSWELHVPEHFTPEHPDLAAITQVYTAEIDSHPLGKLYPKSSAKASTQLIDKSIRPLLVPPNFPTTFDDLVRRQWPQLSLFVSTFDDATIVSLLWPHTMMDAGGLQSLLKNWSLAMAERRDEVEPVFSSPVDPLHILDEGAGGASPHTLDSSRMPWWKILNLGLCFVWRHFTQPTPEKRFIYLPHESLEKLKSRTLEQAREVMEEKGAFIAEGDILTAWLAQAVVAGTKKHIPATIVDVVNLRTRLSCLEPASIVYLQNLLGMNVTLASADQMSSSTASVALLRRQALEKQLHEHEMTELVRRLRFAIRRSSLPPIFFGSSKAMIIPFNNVSKTSYIEATDFSPAVMRSRHTREGNKTTPGIPSFVFTEPINMTNIAGFCFVWGKDPQGGLWLSSSMPRGGWELLEKDLATL